MSSQIKQVVDSSMGRHESLRLSDRFESSHPSLPHSSRFMGLFDPIIGVLIGDMNGFRNNLSMRYAVTP
jgi:hypothetical protein